MKQERMKFFFFLVADCLKYMQQGCDLIKYRSNARRYRRRFTLDLDCSTIRWTPTNKKPHKAISNLCFKCFFLSAQLFVLLLVISVYVDQIKEVRLGGKSPRLGSTGEAATSIADEIPDDCMFTLVFGDAYDSLDLIASSADEANIWMTGLMALAAGNCRKEIYSFFIYRLIVSSRTFNTTTKH